MSELPFGFTIGPPVPELRLDERQRRDDYGYDWRDRRSSLDDIGGSQEFPKPVEVDTPEALRTTKMFGCSGGVDSSRYLEATKFRTMQGMGWEEARVALNRLIVPVRYDRDGETSERVALAEFALSAVGFTDFVGKRGEHAVKLRDALGDAGNILHQRLSDLLQKAESNARSLARPITLHGDPRNSHEDVADSIVRAFWTPMPTTAEEWVIVIEATPDQAAAALNHLRTTLATWVARRPVAAGILERLGKRDAPTAVEYAEAVHIADMLVFTGTKLLTLYAGIMHSMPIYRLYPTISEAEAIALWWPWGRPAPLVGSVPPGPPKPSRPTLDPSIITAKRPQDVVKEIVEKTGLNRTTAQSMTAALRKKMRADREWKARMLLYEGLTKAEVAKRVGLSPSRISALFKNDQSIAEHRRSRELQRAFAAHREQREASKR
jgi:hypothetical protein